MRQKPSLKDAIKTARIGGYLVGLRQRKGVTQQEVAKRSKESQDAISKIESGKLLLPIIVRAIKEVNRIAQIYQMNKEEKEELLKMILD